MFWRDFKGREFYVFSPALPYFVVICWFNQRFPLVSRNAAHKDLVAFSEVPVYRESPAQRHTRELMQFAMDLRVPAYRGNPAYFQEGQEHELNYAKQNLVNAICLGLKNHVKVTVVDEGFYKKVSGSIWIYPEV